MKALQFAVSMLIALAPAVAPAATFTVTPAAISNTYAGTITLQIGGLTNGETVVVQKFLDSNTNGVIDSADWLVQQFNLTDGTASVIGGVTNFNVPGDSTPTNAAITAQLNLQISGIEQQFVGKYAFKLSSPSDRFTPRTNILTITNAAYAQSFAGTVTCAGTNVSGASVLLFPGPIGNSSPQGGTVTDGSGSYIIRAAPGSYTLLPLKPGYVVDMAVAPSLSLTTGATVATNLSLLPADRTISGRVVDAANTSIGLPGLLMFVSSTNSLATMGFTDTNGNFVVPVTASQWRLQFDSQEVPVTGYLQLQARPRVDTTTGSVAGVTIALPKGTALIYGSVKDSQNHPLPGVRFYPGDTSGQYEGNATTDQNGNYAIAVRGGQWYVEAESESPGYTNYVFSGGYDITLADGQAIRQDFSAILATNHITGYVRDNTNGPISGVDVWCEGTINGTNYKALSVYTDDNGYYSFNVANGTWNVQPACDDEPGLSQLGYQCVNEQQVTINNNNAVANFVAQSCAVQILTTNLPDGQVGVYYHAWLQASSCNPSFTWSVISGSPPPWMNGNPSTGEIYGTPTTPGTYYVTVQVTDGDGHSAQQNLSLYIAPSSIPLQVMTTWLPTGTNTMFYSQALQASGGTPPYTWAIPAYSADPPPNLTLATNGVLSGALAANGTFYFDVEVSDSTAGTAYQTLSLNIVNPPPPPLVITNVSLPNGTVGIGYSAQLGATGGQPPYNWALALGSASLPPDLSLDPGGLISGVPMTNKVSTFKVQVTDANFATTNKVLSITINGRPVLSSPNWAANRFQMQLTGASNQNYAIQVSTNLSSTNWISLFTTNNATTDSFLIVDPNATNKQRFYRAVQTP